MREMSNAVLFDLAGDTLVVTFARPAMRSPLSVAVVEVVQQKLDELNSRTGDAIERVIFTGQEDCFASGADLREIAALSEHEAREFGLRGQRLMNTIAALSQITIAAINGFCFGGALDLALACDRRVASPDAVFSHPGAQLGIMTGWGGTQRLPRLIGEAATLEMFFTAGRVDAREALRIGLIDEVDPDPLDSALRTARSAGLAI
ncbi:MAG: enoyl-CoA hydratase/isomerase family protein [Pyrinomonadaceae bacterium]